MEFGILFLVTAVLIAGIWIVIELKRFRHKISAIILIALILFFYLSLTFVFKNNDLNFGTIDGLTQGTKLYFSWLGSIFDNIKEITLNAIKMDWVSD
ncbi:hypothetical protein K9L16_00135 [Candidatus Pacearchaeota archaeon]|nr:hypothetical protein [Candidatus Pacearchaeota archaeon]